MTRAAVALLLLLGLAGCGSVTPTDLLQVRKDLITANQAAETAYWRHLASNPDDVKGAVGAGYSASTDSQKGSYTNAEQSGGKMPGWLAIVLGLLGTTSIGGAVAVIVRKMFRAYDALPLEGKDGRKVDEGDLVSMVSAMWEGFSKAKAPA